MAKPSPDEAAQRAAKLDRAVLALMAEAAERAILPRYRLLLAHEVREKAADELVTVADQESEDILASGLARLIPEAAIVGEEAADADPALLEQLGAPLCWIIDPLDGTANFAAGDGPFGMLIALASGGEVVAGWIYDPRSRRFVAAAKGHGVTVDGNPLQPPSPADRRPRAAISSLFERDPRLRATVVERIEREFTTVPIPRCAAEQYPRMLLGLDDLTLFQRTLPWDHAAGVICLREAGGRATRFDGSPYRVNDPRPGLIAAASAEAFELAFGLLAGIEPR